MEWRNGNVILSVDENLTDRQKRFCKVVAKWVNICIKDDRQLEKNEKAGWVEAMEKYKGDT